MQQIANILEQPISPQTSPRKTRKRPYSLVRFIPVGAGAAPACTRKKKIKNIYIFEFSASWGICTYMLLYMCVHMYVCI